jgi:hypothetical protein
MIEWAAICAELLVLTLPRAPVPTLFLNLMCGATCG